MEILNTKIEDILSNSNPMLLDCTSAMELINSVNVIGRYTKLEILLKTVNDSKYIASSKQMSEILGFTHVNDILGKTSADIHPSIAGRDLTSWICDVDALTKQHQKINCIEVLNFADGSRIKSSQRELVLNGQMLTCSYHNLDNFKFGFLDMILLKRLKHTGTKCGYNFLANKLFKTGHALIDTLSLYYKEVAYLLMIGLSLQDVADLMDKLRPKIDGTKRNRITIDKAKSVICEKLNLDSNSVDGLIKYLNEMGYYNFIPENIFNLVIGVYK